MSNFGKWGKKPCVIFPCSIQPPPLRTVAVSLGSYGRTVSPFPHAHSTSVVDLTMARKNHHHHSNGHYILSTTPFFSLAVHPHARVEFLFILTHRIFWLYSHNFPLQILRMVWVYTFLTDWLWVCCGLPYVVLCWGLLTFWGRVSINFCT